VAEIEVLFVRDLERDLLVDPGVFREVDRPEASAADRLQDFVLADYLTAEEHPRASINHGETDDDQRRIRRTRGTVDARDASVALWLNRRRAQVLRAGAGRRRRDGRAAQGRRGAPAGRAAAGRRRH